MHTKGTPTPGTQTSVKGEFQNKSIPQPLLGGTPNHNNPNSTPKTFTPTHCNTKTPTYAHQRDTNTRHTNICQRGIEKKYTATPFGRNPKITTTQIQHQTLSHQHILTPKHQHVHTKGTPTPGTQTSVKGDFEQIITPQPLWEGEPKSQ